MTMGYEIAIEAGDAMRMSDCKLLPIWHGLIRYVEDDGKVTYTGISSSYFQYVDSSKRRTRGALLGKLRQLKDHHARTGKRWELERKAEKEAKRAADKAALAARKRLSDAAPELYAACAELIRGADKPGDHLQRVIDLARAALDKADGKCVAINSN
jgi:hypothetical protein